MTLYLSVAIIVLIFVVIFQIAKASEYVSILKGEEASRHQNNKINGFLMVAFLVLGFIGIYVCNKFLGRKEQAKFDKTSGNIGITLSTKYTDVARLYASSSRIVPSCK